MSLRVRLRYSAQYAYERPVSFSPHLLRLFPRSEPGRSVRALDFQISPRAEVQFRRDALDNNVARAFLPDHASLLQISLQAELELRETNAFNFLVDPSAVEWPFRYSPAQALRLAPWLAPLAAEETAPPLPFLPEPSRAGTVELLVGLTSALHREIRYVARPHGAALTPRQTLAQGAGACRDTARLLRATLHGLGFATRLVSGYLWEPPAEVAPDQRRAEGAFHAWTEAFVPGAGWIALDGTNGVFCDHHFIPCAVGLDADDITPVLGSYYADTPVNSTMQSLLHIDPLTT
ncbi:MAG: transglutaminase family protein [Verrucomicrobia bacterium]|nr:transglutaminase family protein [Verrucomicrobiota bacterium]